METLPLKELGLIVLYAVIALLAAPLFAWLRQKANQQKLLARTEIDDYVLGALKVAVENVARNQRARIEAEHPLTGQDKVWLEGLAKKLADEILAPAGLSLESASKPEATSQLIRYLVDEQKAA